MNTQFAVQAGEGGEDVIFLLEINPRASRTVPFVSKATGRPLAKIAARCMAGMTLAAQGVVEEIVPDYYCVKEAIFPFAKFQGVDPILGPERSEEHTSELQSLMRISYAVFCLKKKKKKKTRHIYM